LLDVLKPHQPPLPEFASYIREIDGIRKVDISVVEIDAETETIRVIIDGKGLDYEGLKSHMAKQGAIIHSVDQVIVQ
jgi:hypothetical protein